VLVAQIGTDSETMRNTAEQVDLPRLAGLFQSLLGFMAELGSEDIVDFYY
jgi:CRISPR/Cas system endoribonuclease Cas6 (RAMP superfamily)